jgi:hypothetical protein
MQMSRTSAVPGLPIRATLTLLLLTACASWRELPPAPPARMTVCEENTARICGTFRWTGSEYAAAWADGATARVRVANFTSHEMELRREDSGLNSDFTARYSGTVRGRSTSGIVVWTQADRSWEGTWTAEW